MPEGMVSSSEFGRALESGMGSAITLMIALLIGVQAERAVGVSRHVSGTPVEKYRLVDLTWYHLLEGAVLKHLQKNVRSGPWTWV